MNTHVSTKESEIRKIQGPYGECSYSVVIPIKYLRILGIRKGDYVRIFTEETGRIVITKI